MQVLIWVIIIFLAIFLLWLLRKWIKRLIFIAILLCLAFLIYGLFNPSGASRLWYNVRTFPQRITSWISSNKEFLDYDSYKLNISSIGNKDSTEKNSGSKIDLNDSSNKIDSTSNIDNVGNVGGTQQGGKVENKSKNSESDSPSNITGYSKNDLLGIIYKYIENNLDDETDILVTIEYEDDTTSPDRIILQTQSRLESDTNFLLMPRLSVKKLSNGLQYSKTQTVVKVYGSGELSTDVYKSAGSNEISTEEIISVEESDVATSVSNGNVNTLNGNVNTTPKTLTNQEIKEAEEIFSILF